jgi:Flp pilus assembly protein TadG
MRSHRRANDEGAVLVEFALVIGLFFLLVFGMVDFGLAINTKTQMANAGREGARLGTVNLDPAAVEARVREAGNNLDQAILAVTVECQKPNDHKCTGPGFPAGSLNNAVTGDSVIVTVDYTYDLITPLPGFLNSGNDVALKSVTEMRVE